MFPTHIDNTIRTSYFVCGQQAKYAYIDDLSPIGESVHLHFGGCFATGLEVARRAYFEQGVPHAEAVERGVAAAVAAWGDFSGPQSSPKTKGSLAEGLRYAFDKFPMTTDTYRPHRMEWRFEVPIPGMIHPDTGGPIWYCGRPDTFGDINELLAVHDDKTATSLGKSWGDQWKLDSQFTGYWWAAQELGLLPRGGSNPVLIRGYSILQPKFVEVELAEGEAAPAGVVAQEKPMRGNKVKRWYDRYDRDTSFGHQQTLVYRPQWMIERWLRQLQKDIRRMIYDYENNTWDLALHKGACAAFGGCSYTLLCESEQPEKWVPVNFVKRKWDPLAVI
jgi:hypothetical protein